MGDVISTIGDGLRNAFLMAWEVWWASSSASRSPRWCRRGSPAARSSGALRQGLGPVGPATGLGAASSSCSYAAIAIAKSLFQKGASAASALAFQFASTNLVWELGLVLWVLLGWQFTLAEYLGGIVMIGLMWPRCGLFVSPRAERGARARAARRRRPPAPLGRRASSVARALTSPQAWSDVAHNFLGDWQMLYKEIALGFLLPASSRCWARTSSTGCSSRTRRRPCGRSGRAHRTGHRRPELRLLGRQRPLAAVLWSGGISFAGVMAFIFADLIVLPILLPIASTTAPASRCGSPR